MWKQTVLLEEHTQNLTCSETKGRSNLKGAWVRPLADLGETQEEVGEIGTCTGDTDIGSSHFSEFILTQAHLCW